MHAYACQCATSYDIMGVRMGRTGLQPQTSWARMTVHPSQTGVLALTNFGSDSTKNLTVEWYAGS